MKNIGLIFRKDIGGLLKNFLALVIALGVCALPALYAWFNIYANWDPYANTGNVRIAVVNNDKGWINEDKENINILFQGKTRKLFSLLLGAVFLAGVGLMTRQVLDYIGDGSHYSAKYIY